jgi:hypothetical protein
MRIDDCTTSLPANRNARAILLQAAEMQRYQRHLRRQGLDVTLDQAAARWIVRFSALWRTHYNGRAA